MKTRIAILAASASMLALAQADAAWANYRPILESKGVAKTDMAGLPMLKIARVVGVSVGASWKNEANRKDADTKGLRSSSRAPKSPQGGKTTNTRQLQGRAATGGAVNMIK